MLTGFWAYDLLAVISLATLAALFLAPVIAGAADSR